MSVIISHFYNEEYLLPYWLNHHKKIFEHGIMIDYSSTDKSVEIIKDICPTWNIVNSRNDDFSAVQVDYEVYDYEKQIKDGVFKMALNVTEFLICNPEIFKTKEKTQYFIPGCIMVDNQETKYKDLNNENLIKQRTNGIYFLNSKYFTFRQSRSLHNFQPNMYTPGRHFNTYNTDKAIICWYGFSPFNERGIARKLQIQNKIPQNDKNMGFGQQHITDKEKLEIEYNKYLLDSRDIQNEIKNIMGDFYNTF